MFASPVTLGYEARVQPPHRQAAGWWCAGIVVGLFVIYNLNFREIGFGDTIPATLLPAAVIREGHFRLDSFEPLLQRHRIDVRNLAKWVGAIQVRDGQLVSSYPIGAVILAIPVYLVPVLAGALDTWQDYRIAAKVAASLMVALSGGVLYLVARRIAGHGPALVATLAYGLATDAWTVASQALWQHGPGMLCLAVALLALLELERRSRAGPALLAGAALGAAVLCRHLNLVPAVVLTAFVALRHRRYLLPFALPAVAMGAWQVWYNLATFGTLTGGYDAIYLGPGLRDLSLYDVGVFSYPFWLGLGGTLVSPGKGLFVFSPHLVFAVAGAVMAWGAREFPLARYLIVWVAAMLALMAKNVLWWGGGSYGPRYMCEALLPLTLLFAFAWPRLTRRPLLRGAVVLTIALGICVQLVGAFFSPCRWGEDAARKHIAPETIFWNWRDPEITHCLLVGLSDGPRPFEFLAPPPAPPRSWPPPERPRQPRTRRPQAPR